MKRVLTVLLITIATLWSASALAQKVAVVDMRQIFKDSPQAKKIGERLSKQFAGDRQKLEKMSKGWQEDMKTLSRNKSIMDKKSLEALQGKIEKERNELQVAQAKFQQSAMQAQNKAMEEFVNDINAVSTKIAQKEGIDLVLYKNVVVYSKSNIDLTKKIIEQMK